MRTRTSENVVTLRQARGRTRGVEELGKARGLAEKPGFEPGNELYTR